MSLHTSRRNLLAMVPAATAVAAMPAAAIATAPSPLDNAISAYHRARAIYGRWHRVFHDPIWDAYIAEVDALPHHTEYLMGSDGTQYDLLTTAKPTDVDYARHTLKTPRMETTSFGKQCVAIIKAADERDAEVHALDRKYRIDELTSRSEKLRNAKWDALIAIEDTPVDSLSEVMRKIKFLEWHQEEEDYSHEICGEWMITDLRRIAGEDQS